MSSAVVSPVMLESLFLINIIISFPGRTFVGMSFRVVVQCLRWAMMVLANMNMPAVTNSMTLHSTR